MNTILLRCLSCRTLNRVPADKINNQPICGRCKTRLQVPHLPVNGSGGLFDGQVREWPEFLLIEFGAKWCGYCRMMDPVLNNLADQRAGMLKIMKIDVDAEPVLARRFRVTATPTFLVYRNGTQIARLDGAPKEKLEFVQWLDGIMSGQSSSARMAS